MQIQESLAEGATLASTVSNIPFISVARLDDAAGTQGRNEVAIEGQSHFRSRKRFTSSVNCCGAWSIEKWLTSGCSSSPALGIALP
jgi:hypothetical protein